MPHEVIMPALGMAQDTGILVAWRKALGDEVSVGDILMEVETDKSTMEVEAAAAGFVTELRAEAGSEIPVGQVIAIISETADAPINASQPSETKQETQEPEVVAVVPVPEPAPEPIAAPMPQKPDLAPVGGRILASPKARRLATEQGLDLSRLVAAGVPQPYRVADLDTLKKLPHENIVSQRANNHITARVAAQGFTQFCEWLDAEALEVGPTNGLWAAFAAACMRNEAQAGSIVIRVDRPASGIQADYIDPDRERLSTLRPEEGSAPDLILHDLTGSRIIDVQYGISNCPTLSVVQNNDTYELTLSFTEAQLSAQQAFALLDGFAERLETPLRHLL